MKAASPAVLLGIQAPVDQMVQEIHGLDDSWIALRNPRRYGLSLFNFSPDPRDFYTPTYSTRKMIFRQAMFRGIAKFEPGQPTTLAPRAPRTVEFALGIPGETVFARILRLDPGGYLNKHKDLPRSLREQPPHAMLYVPLTTNPHAYWFVWETDRLMQQICRTAGEVWHVNLSHHHAVMNHGTGPRIVLQIMKMWNDGLRALVEAGT